MSPVKEQHLMLWVVPCDIKKCVFPPSTTHCNSRKDHGQQLETSSTQSINTSADDKLSKSNNPVLSRETISPTTVTVDFENLCFEIVGGMMPEMKDNEELSPRGLAKRNQASYEIDYTNPRLWYTSTKEKPTRNTNNNLNDVFRSENLMESSAFKHERMLNKSLPNLADSNCAYVDRHRTKTKRKKQNKKQSIRARNEENVEMMLPRMSDRNNQINGGGVGGGGGGGDSDGSLFPKLANDVVVLPKQVAVNTGPSENHCGEISFQKYMELRLAKHNQDNAENQFSFEKYKLQQKSILKLHLEDYSNKMKQQKADARLWIPKDFYKPSKRIRPKKTTTRTATDTKRVGSDETVGGKSSFNSFRARLDIAPDDDETEYCIDDQDVIVTTSQIIDEKQQVILPRSTMKKAIEPQQLVIDIQQPCGQTGISGDGVEGRERAKSQIGRYVYKAPSDGYISRQSNNNDEIAKTKTAVVTLALERDVVKRTPYCDKHTEKTARKSNSGYTSGYNSAIDYSSSCDELIESEDDTETIGELSRPSTMTLRDNSGRISTATTDMSLPASRNHTGRVRSRNIQSVTPGFESDTRTESPSKKSVRFAKELENGSVTPARSRSKMQTPKSALKRFNKLEPFAERNRDKQDVINSDRCPRVENTERLPRLANGDQTGEDTTRTESKMAEIVESYRRYIDGGDTEAVDLRDTVDQDATELDTAPVTDGDVMDIATDNCTDNTVNNPQIDTNNDNVEDNQTLPVSNDDNGNTDVDVVVLPSETDDKNNAVNRDYLLRQEKHLGGENIEDTEITTEVEFDNELELSNSNNLDDVEDFDNNSSEIIETVIETVAEANIAHDLRLKGEVDVQQTEPS
ncbi:uncharacterized protein LOC141909854 isoform X2 [Tubulanus polymorphus]